jgi:hypothetical protein
MHFMKDSLLKKEDLVEPGPGEPGGVVASE